VEERNYNYRNLTINPRTYLDRYAQDPTRGDGWKAPGYNVNNNSITVEKVNTGTDTSARTFRPY
jgi:hypothetical protein